MATIIPAIARSSIGTRNARRENYHLLIEDGLIREVSDRFRGEPQKLEDVRETGLASLDILTAAGVPIG